MNTTQINIIDRARYFAVGAHAGQKYDSHPYEAHLLHVGVTLLHFSLSEPELLAAAWLHDTLEDTKANYQDLLKFFGTKIANTVLAVSSQPGKNRKERVKGVYAKVLAEGKLAVALKLADRISNTEYSILSGNTNKTKMYKKEYNEFWAGLYSEPDDFPDMWKYLNSLTLFADKSSIRESSQLFWGCRLHT